MSWIAILFGSLAIGLFIFIGCMAIREGLIYVADAIKGKR